MTGYSDADWRGDVTDRKSTSGILLKIGNTPVFWKSKKQRCVSLSTSEAEFIAMSEACQNIIWISAMLQSIGLSSGKPTVL